MPDELLPSEQIRSRIYFIRGQKVMLDRDLAELYGVETKYLNRQVKRNLERFPKDFMYQLTADEASRCQNVTLKRGQNIKYLPYAFTEHGVSMLSGVLNSKRAIHINIQIMRAFVEMRHYLINKGEIEQVLKGLMDKQVSEAMDALYKLVEGNATNVSINTGDNSPVTISSINVGGTNKWADEAYKLIQKILADLDEVKLPAKAEKVIQENSKSLVGLLEEGRPARRRLKECLATIKTTLEMAAISSSIVNGIMERIQQIMKLLG